jgi:tetratricopeptide (TPR) repeat protein
MAADAIACPACGTRNKPKWEYCARCGESLQGATVVTAPGKTPPKTKGKSKVKILIHEQEKESALPPGAIVALSLVLVAVLGFAAWRAVSQAPAPQAAADPKLFTLPTTPSGPPPAQAPASGPGSADFNEGVRLLAAGRAAEAVSFLAKAASEASNNARYQSVYGEALMAVGDKENALGRLADAARLEPAGFSIPYARALAGAGRDAEAIPVFEQALASGTSPAVGEELAKVYYKVGNYAKAAPLLEQAANSRPNDPVIKQELAYAVSQTGDKARAVELYRSVIALAPGADMSRGRLSELLFEQGKGDEALGILKAGIDINPTLPDLRRRLGNMLERAGKPQEAIQQYREYAKLAPNAPDAKDLAERAARLEGAGKS